ncbi:MAG: hypothetical protein II776_01690 [Clostridia bacterium]|nr:hypothetical protein [Clostridia bacterium]
MNEKPFLTLCAAVSLGVGAGIYFLFRPGTLFLSGLPFAPPLGDVSFPGDGFVRFFLPDLLWCSSLCFALFRLHKPSSKKALWLSVLAFGSGCGWELLQYTGVCAGTGDVWDCLAYGAGSVLALSILFLKRRKT